MTLIEYTEAPWKQRFRKKKSFFVSVHLENPEQKRPNKSEFDLNCGSFTATSSISSYTVKIYAALSSLSDPVTGK